MLPPRPRSNRDRFDVRMTPLIDVVFLLLIFFVCTASFRRPEELLPTNLSAVGAVETSEPTPPPEDLGEVIVMLRQEADRVAWEVSGRRLDQPDDVRTMLASLARLKRDLPIILDVGGDVPIRYALDTYDWCRLAGFATIQFAASVE